MSTRRLLLLAIVLATVGLVMSMQVAFAGVPDPLSQPAESVDLITQLWRSGQLPQAVIVTAFLILTIASRKIPWLAGDHRGIYVAAALAGLGMLAESASRGTTPNTAMVLSAVMTAFALVLNGKAPAQVAAGVPFRAAVTSKPPIVVTRVEEQPESGSQQ